MKRPIVALIAAVARNGVIGDGNRLLWHIPEDMRFFRRTTAGHPVIMGRKTWDSLPERFRPLPGRRNIVVTRQAGWRAEGAESARSVEAAVALSGDAGRVFVIGGAELYAAAMPLADELVLTRIGRDFEGTTHFPPLEHEFTETARESVRAAPPNDFNIDFVTLRRRD
ncbi:MAG TPA: dihydrofolate reductase [Rubrivivax sp.]